MDFKTQQMIKNNLRRTWTYSQERKSVKAAARVELEKGHFKNGKVIVRVFYECAHCKGHFKSDEVAVDHISCVGSFSGSWDDYISRLFCDVLNLQTLCRTCHDVKSKSEWHESRGLI